MKQSLKWAHVVDIKYEDDMKSWPKMYRRSASEAIVGMREEHFKGAKFVSQKSSCEPYEDRYGLLLEVVVDV